LTGIWGKGLSVELRDAEGDGAEAAGEGFGFITVGVAVVGIGVLGLEDVVTFNGAWVR
jgi:hypothetical protein